MAKRKLADASINQFLERRGCTRVLSPSPGQCSKSANWIQEGVTEGGIKEQWPESNPRLIKKCPSGLNISCPKGWSQGLFGIEIRCAGVCVVGMAVNGKEKDSRVGGQGGRNENEHELTRIQPTSHLHYWIISEGDVLFGGCSWCFWADPVRIPWG